jgi:hypothetical protein
LPSVTSFGSDNLTLWTLITGLDTGPEVQKPKIVAKNTTGVPGQGQEEICSQIGGQGRRSARIAVYSERSTASRPTAGECGELIADAVNCKYVPKLRLLGKKNVPQKGNQGWQGSEKSGPEPFVLVPALRNGVMLF